MKLIPGAAPKSPTRTSRVRQERIALARVAFDKAYRHLYSRACSLVRKYAEDETEDIVQQAFLELWNACYRNGDLPDESPKGFLYRALRQRLVDRIRSHSLRIGRDVDVEQVDDEIVQPTNPLDARRVADGNLLQARIDYLLAAMPPKTAQAYQLSTELHRDPDAIATALGVSKDTARWHVWEAKRRLRAALTRDGYRTGDDAGDEGITS